MCKDNHGDFYNIIAAQGFERNLLSLFILLMVLFNSISKKQNQMDTNLMF